MTDDDFPTDRLADGWELWASRREGRVVLAFHPETFDGDSYPEPCLPTIYLSNGSRRRRPGAGARTTDEWEVTLFLEPEVEVVSDAVADHAAGVDRAVELADQFAAGRIDYRDAYQLPRESYLDALDRLIGRE